MEYRKRINFSLKYFNHGEEEWKIQSLGSLSPLKNDTHLLTWNACSTFPILSKITELQVPTLLLIKYQGRQNLAYYYNEQQDLLSSMKFSLDLVDVQVIILSFTVERMKYSPLSLFKMLSMHEFQNIISKVRSLLTSVK